MNFILKYKITRKYYLSLPKIVKQTILNKLNFFKTWEGIRKIAKIPKNN